jgi:hypothetical protein
MGDDSFVLNKEIIASYTRVSDKHHGTEDGMTWDDESQGNRTSETSNTHPVSELQ